jgi:hypothetical protein
MKKKDTLGSIGFRAPETHMPTHAIPDLRQTIAGGLNLIFSPPNFPPPPTETKGGSVPNPISPTNPPLSAALEIPQGLPDCQPGPLQSQE